jgi:hypothetical protein
VGEMRKEGEIAGKGKSLRVVCRVNLCLLNQLSDVRGFIKIEKKRRFMIISDNYILSVEVMTEFRLKHYSRC